MSKTDAIIAKAYGVTRIEKWKAPKPKFDWRAKAEALASKMEKIAKISHKHEVQYWMDDSRSDKDKLHAILNEAREAIANFRNP